jgi:tetratricopeptide (TPR) repeat protein
MSRAKLNKTSDRLGDLKKALALAPDEWRTYQFLSDYYAETGNAVEAEKLWASAAAQFHDNVVVSIGYAKALLDSKKYNECLAILKRVYVLPQEHANQGHNIYEQANLAIALEKIQSKQWDEAISFLNAAKKWPEHLGSGEPYDADNRLSDLLLAYCEQQNGNRQQAQQYKKQIVDYTLKMWPAQKSVSNYIGLVELADAGQQDKINDLLAAWKNQSDSLQKWGLPGGSSNIMQNYVAAKIKNDASANQLQQKMLTNNNDLLTRLLLEAIRIVYKQE